MILNWIFEGSSHLLKESPKSFYRCATASDCKTRRIDNSERPCGQLRIASSSTFPRIRTNLFEWRLMSFTPKTDGKRMKLPVSSKLSVDKRKNLRYDVCACLHFGKKENTPRRGEVGLGPLGLSSAPCTKEVAAHAIRLS